MLRSTVGWLKCRCVRTVIQTSTWQLGSSRCSTNCAAVAGSGLAASMQSTRVMLRKGKKDKDKETTSCCKWTDLICLWICLLKVSVQLLECKHVWKTPQDVPCQGFNCLYAAPCDLCVCTCVCLCVFVSSVAIVHSAAWQLNMQKTCQDLIVHTVTPSSSSWFDSTSAEKKLFHVKNYDTS